VGVLDFAFVAQRIAIEIDGRAWHSTGERFQSDRSRQNRLVLMGWTVLRFTWDDLVRRPDAVIEQVPSALRKAP
jgi:very-short-patch-repair endonuclease